jgi:hypothetical protein
LNPNMTNPSMREIPSRLPHDAFIRESSLGACTIIYLSIYLPYIYIYIHIYTYIYIYIYAHARSTHPMFTPRDARTAFVAGERLREQALPPTVGERPGALAPSPAMYKIRNPGGYRNVCGFVVLQNIKTQRFFMFSFLSVAGETRLRRRREQECCASIPGETRRDQALSLPTASHSSHPPGSPTNPSTRLSIERQARPGPARPGPALPSLPGPGLPPISQRGRQLVGRQLVGEAVGGRGSWWERQLVGETVSGRGSWWERQLVGETVGGRDSWWERQLAGETVGGRPTASLSSLH